MLHPDNVFIKIEFIFSNNVTLQGVDVYYPTTHKGLRLMIGASTEVCISDLSIMYGGPTHLGVGGEMDIFQSANIVISNVSFTDFNDIQCIADVCYSRNHTFPPFNIYGLPAVVYLQSSSGVTFENCSFIDNSATSLKVIDAIFTLSGIVNFTS